MTSVLDALRHELRFEAGATRQLLERAPAERMAWRPHPKSRALGQVLAQLADIPGLFLAPIASAAFDRAAYAPTREEKDAILARFDANHAAASTFSSRPGPVASGSASSSRSPGW